MTALLELRQKIADSYGKYETYIKIISRFILAFLVMYFISLQIGTGSIINNVLFVLAFSMLCAFFPVSCITPAVCIYMLACLFAVSAAAGVYMLIILLIFVFLYFSFRPGNAVIMIVVLLLSMLNISGAAAVPLALICGPLAVIPAVFGICAYNVIFTVRQNYTIIAQGTVSMTQTEKFSYMIEASVKNERIIMLIAAFLIAMLIVYEIRRLPYSYSWLIAIASGEALYVLAVMIGNVLFAVSISILYLSLAVAGGVVISLLLHSFMFLLDGAHAEYLQYEDDVYMYYVKAIPKYSVSVSDKWIKKITDRDKNNEIEE